MKKILVLMLALAMVFCLAGCAADVGTAIPDPGITVGGNTLAALTADFFAAILRLLLLALLYLFSKLLLPLLKNTVIPWLESKHLMGIVRIFVASAEKKGETGEIKKANKKAYVIALLEKRGIPITPLVLEMIEAAVEELDKMGAQLGELLLEPIETPASDEAGAGE